VALILYKGYRLTRLTAFLDPWKDANNTGFQIIQSLLSFGSGGTFGVGIGDGMQNYFIYPNRIPILFFLLLRRKAVLLE